MIAEWLRRGASRAYRRRGFERETAVLIIKCALAATLAYLVAYLMGESTQIGFAPFTALLIVRPSVYGSMLQSGRYVAAVFVGALLAGVTGLSVGPEIWAFALVVLVALVVGQSRFFGGQGTQIPVVTAFALAGGTATNTEDLWSLLLMVCVGAASALLVNIVLAPAIRFRDAENAVLDFADGLRSLTEEMAAGVRRGEEGLDLDHWTRAADGFDGTMSNALESVYQQKDRFRLNPRRLLARKEISVEQLENYRDWIYALSRASRHVQSLVRTLRTTFRSSSRLPAPDEAFLKEFAPLLERVSEVLRTVHDSEEPEHHAVSEDLRELVEAALREVDAERERMREVWSSEHWPVYSALLTDTERLLEEICEGQENTGDSGQR